MFCINPNTVGILFELWTVQHPPPVPLSCPLCRPSAASRSMMIFAMIPPTIPASALSLFGSSGCSSSLLRYRGAMASQPESTGQSGTSHSTPMDVLGRLEGTNRRSIHRPRTVRRKSTLGHLHPSSYAVASPRALHHVEIEGPKGDVGLDMLSAIDDDARLQIDSKGSRRRPSAISRAETASTPREMPMSMRSTSSFLLRR